MIERAILIFWGLWLLLILIAAFRVFGFLLARRRQDKRWGDGFANQKPAVVILAAKGFDLKSTPRFFDALFAQDYTNYRVIVCFESWSDPVAQWLKEELELSEGSSVWTHPDADAGLKSITLTCAGLSADEGQKVHNQRAAFEQLEDEDAIVAFADADISLSIHWLTKLLAPINQETHPLSTTYRWLVPKRPTLPNQVASVINGSITTQGGSELTNILWGGSMAIKREVFDELNVPELLAGSLNDDLRLSKAARKAGNKIAFIRSLVLPTSIDFTWKSFFEFARRQYTQVKFFSPILYTGTNIIITFYALGVISLVGGLIYGYFHAWIPIAAAYVIDQFRGLVRQQIYLSLFQDDGIRRKLFAASWLEHMLTPFWMLMHWIILVSTWTQDTLTWAGIRYRILSKSSTRILDRATTDDTLPVGVPGLALLATLRDRKRGTYTGPIRPHRTGAITPVTEPTAPIEAVPAVEEAAIAATEAVPPTGPIAPVTATSSIETEPEPELADAEMASLPEPEAEAEIEPAAIEKEAAIEKPAAMPTAPLAAGIGAPGIPLLGSPPAYRPRRTSWNRAARERQRKWNPLVPDVSGRRRKAAPAPETRGTGLPPKTRIEAVTTYRPTLPTTTTESVETPTKSKTTAKTTAPATTLALPRISSRLQPLVAAQFPSLHRQKPRAAIPSASPRPTADAVRRARSKTRLQTATYQPEGDAPIVSAPPASFPPQVENAKQATTESPRPETSPIIAAPATLAHSSAARRTNAGRRKLRMGTTARKSARSGRANHVFHGARGSRRTRPTSHRPSGRPS